MPKLHQTKARTDIYRNGLKTPATNKQGFTLDRSKPANGKDTVIVKKGETYYWWQFAYGTKQISLTKPRRSQLTQSGFNATIWDIEDVSLGELSADDVEGLVSEVENIISELETLRDEQEEKKDNMPEGLQEGDTGQLLQGRYDSLQEMIDELEQIDLDYDEEEAEGDEDEKADHLRQWLDEKIMELSSVSYNGE